MDCTREGELELVISFECWRCRGWVLIKENDRALCANCRAPYVSRLTEDRVVSITAQNDEPTAEEVSETLKVLGGGWKLIGPDEEVKRIEALLKRIAEVPPNDFRRMYHGRFEPQQMTD